MADMPGGAVCKNACDYACVFVWANNDCMCGALFTSIVRKDSLMISVI